MRRLLIVGAGGYGRSVATIVVAFKLTFVQLVTLSGGFG
jgi:hypothetical protein